MKGEALMFQLYVTLFSKFNGRKQWDCGLYATVEDAEKKLAKLRKDNRIHGFDIVNTKTRESVKFS